uniref:Uncharacterized protein n=1 Tax=viral metagenome TaxID=1070528 RepID=A0A6C0D872_9ZZZZ
MGEDDNTNFSILIGIVSFLVLCGCLVVYNLIREQYHNKESLLKNEV